MLENNFYKALFGVSDTNLAKLIIFSQVTGKLNNKIYSRIESDLDRKGLENKKKRIEDKMYIAKQTGLLCEEFSYLDENEFKVSELGIGRSRISAEEVFIFICLRGYFDSVTSEEASERMVESVSLQIYYLDRNRKMPKPKTINENLNAISSETMEFIHTCQLKQFLNEFYIRHLVSFEENIKTAKLKPSEMNRLQYLYEHLEDDLLAVSAVLYYTEQRVFFDKKLPSTEKILSLSDTTAAFIKKGDRNSIIGYKPQIGMSKNGYVTALIIEPGNGADSTYFAPLVKMHIENTGVTPGLASADDGYSSAAGRKDVLELGVKDVSFSGAVGRKILGEELWRDEKYTEARRNRSAVESLMFSLKYTVHFGRLRRRGIEAVKCEMLGKVIAYNYLHKIVRLEKLEKLAA